MSASKSLAFVLKTQDYRDTSLLADFYTRDYGRVRGIVKGIRDTRARFGSTLEPFSLNEILFYRRRKGADLHLITQVDLIELYPKLRTDLDRLSAASYCIELVAELVEPDEPNEAIFDLLSDILKFLESGASAKRTMRIFEVKLLEELGLMPEIRQCVFCREEPKETVYFNPSLGGIQCKSCAQTRTRPDQAVGQPVSKGALHFLQHVERSAVLDLVSVKVSQEVGEEVERVLRRFTDYQLHHKLKSLVFMEKIGLA